MVARSPLNSARRAGSLTRSHIVTARFLLALQMGAQPSTQNRVQFTLHVRHSLSLSSIPESVKKGWQSQGFVPPADWSW